MLKPVFSQHEHPQASQFLETFNLLDTVAVQINEHQFAKGFQSFQFHNEVVLKV